MRNVASVIFGLATAQIVVLASKNNYEFAFYACAVAIVAVWVRALVAGSK